MKDEDIEILEDFDAPQGSQLGSVPDQNMQTPPVAENDSANDFEKMVNEGNKIEEQPISNADQFQDNNYQNYNNQYGDNYHNNQYSNDVNNNLSTNDYNQYNNQNNYNDYNYNDANNDLIASNEQNNQDLTITAVYPNGFVVPDQEEVVATKKPKKKMDKVDIILIIIVIILVITLAAMLIFLNF